jgi:hypothetical protein
MPALRPCVSARRRGRSRTSGIRELGGCRCGCGRFLAHCVQAPVNASQGRVRALQLADSARSVSRPVHLHAISPGLLAASAADRYRSRTRRSAALVIVEYLNACFAIQAGLLPVEQLAVFVDELVTLRVDEPKTDPQAASAYCWCTGSPTAGRRGVTKEAGQILKRSLPSPTLGLLRGEGCRADRPDAVRRGAVDHKVAHDARLEDPRVVTRHRAGVAPVSVEVLRHRDPRGC